MATKPTDAVYKACELLRERVRYEGAYFELPATNLLRDQATQLEIERDDTHRIRVATKLYVDTWIMPLIIGIQTGDTKSLRELTKGYE